MVDLVKVNLRVNTDKTLLNEGSWLCEQAGTGIRMMKNQWQELGHPEPELTNDRSHKAFEFRLGPSWD